MKKREVRHACRKADNEQTNLIDVKNINIHILVSDSFLGVLGKSLKQALYTNQSVGRIRTVQVDEDIAVLSGGAGGLNFTKDSKTKLEERSSNETPMERRKRLT